MAKKTSSRERTLGIPDSEFFQRYPRKGLITKMEVRVISLARLNLREESVFWDIGAGSGSISIEAAMIVKRGKVFAIEKNPHDIQNIKKNIKKFGVSNIEIIPMFAPEGFDVLPDPDATFIGGSSSRLKGILECVCQRLNPYGSIVMNAASVENLSIALGVFKRLGWPTEITMVMIARSKTTGALTRFESLNPVFVLIAQRLHKSSYKKGQLKAAKSDAG